MSVPDFDPESLDPEDPFVVIARAQPGLPAPAMRAAAPAMRAGGGEGDPGDDSLVERTRRTIRSILKRFERRSEACRPRVKALLALPRAERWREMDNNPALHEVAVGSELLRSARGPDLPSHEAEALALLVLQLVPRLRFEDQPVRWAGDLAARAWAHLAELALERRDRKAADFAVEAARAFLGVGSGDAQLVFEVGLVWAFLEWSQGRGQTAAASLKTLLRLAKELADPALEVEAALWLSRLSQQLGDDGQAFGCFSQAAKRLKAGALREALGRHTRTAERLGLTLPSTTRPPAPPDPPNATPRSPE